MMVVVVTVMMMMMMFLLIRIFTFIIMIMVVMMIDDGENDTHPVSLISHKRDYTVYIGANKFVKHALCNNG